MLEAQSPDVRANLPLQTRRWQFASCIAVCIKNKKKNKKKGVCVWGQKQKTVTRRFVRRWFRRCAGQRADAASRKSPPPVYVTHFQNTRNIFDVNLKTFSFFLSFFLASEFTNSSHGMMQISTNAWPPLQSRTEVGIFRFTSFLFCCCFFFFFH